MKLNKYWIWLTMVFGAGSTNIWEVMAFYDSPVSAYEDLTSGSSIFRLTEKQKKAVASTPLSTAESVLGVCERLGVSVINIYDEEYPVKLRDLFDPPCVLYYRGSIASLSGSRTAVAVGARKASDYSLGVCSRVCTELSEKGTVIISGFAVGTDITAHMAAAGHGRPTVCVLGCGVDHDYPKENFRYRDRIISSGGGFLSEYPPGTEPKGYNFPKRNRILAALGDVTMVFEASSKSGSLITAGLAAEYGRDVLCLPPADIYAERYSGNVGLLRDGAIPLLSSDDVIDCFSSLDLIESEHRPLSVPDAPEDDIPDKPEIPEEKEETPSAEPPAAEDIPEVQQAPADLTDEDISQTQREIYNILKKGAMRIDDIALHLATDAEAVMTDLTEMELTGIITQLPGKFYKIR